MYIGYQRSTFFKSVRGASLDIPPPNNHERYMSKFSGTNADREILTTSRIGNLTRLIHTLAICATIHGRLIPHTKSDNTYLVPIRDIDCLFLLNTYLLHM